MTNVGRLLLFVSLGATGCAGTFDIERENKERRGIVDEPPSDHAIRAAIVGDVRNVWLPEAELEKGTPGTECSGIRYEGAKPFCSYCKGHPPMKAFALREDAPDKQHPVRETAYFCETESAYWYHYHGGPLKRDVWMGPRRVRLRTPKDE